jgi:hypothetical protein
MVVPQKPRSFMEGDQLTFGVNVIIQKNLVLEMVENYLKKVEEVAEKEAEKEANNENNDDYVITDYGLQKKNSVNLKDFESVNVNTKLTLTNALSEKDVTTHLMMRDGATAYISLHGQNFSVNVREVAEKCAGKQLEECVPQIDR